MLRSRDGSQLQFPRYWDWLIVMKCTDYYVGHLTSPPAPAPPPPSSLDHETSHRVDHSRLSITQIKACRGILWLSLCLYCMRVHSRFFLSMEATYHTITTLNDPQCNEDILFLEVCCYGIDLSISIVRFNQ